MRQLDFLPVLHIGSFFFTPSALSGIIYLLRGMPADSLPERGRGRNAPGADETYKDSVLCGLSGEEKAWAEQRIWEKKLEI